MLKQKDGTNGVKMLVAARNDSLARFTRELKQPQATGNKKVMINLSPSGRTVGAPSVPVSPLPGGIHAKDSHRKKVNFDLPQISASFVPTTVVIPTEP